MAKSRTEIDKDMMYRKIMPSAVRNGRTDSDSQTEGSTNLSISQDKNTNMEKKSTTEIEKITSSPRLRYSSGLQLPEPQDMVLINLMEELVLNRLDSTLMRFNCCKCNKCKKDIAALTLNKLRPHYVVMKRGDEEKKKAAEEKFSSEVTGALVQAIMLVKKEPRH